VVENFSVGVMHRPGLDYESCRALRPDIICISLPGFGGTGPEKGHAAYGLTQEAMSGFASVTGYPGEVPIDTGVFYGDPTGGLFGAAAVSTALWRRMQTGEGQQIDLSQREAFATVLPELVFEYTMNDRVMSSVGNRHPSFAPHGVYQCSGDEAWVAITATTDEQFDAFREVMGLADDSRFSTMSNRKANEDALDELIGGWVGQRNPHDVMRQLQARGFFEEVTHPDAGTHAQIGMPWKMSETPVHIRLPAPGLGEHNDYVLGEVLGCSGEELQSLTDRDVIGVEPLGARR
jgi:crotonobetainyl-CoA:carnitine CoA-transferase CaiB-like acyl-CoA transferase